jgi:hypothetical protein
MIFEVERLSVKAKYYKFLMFAIGNEVRVKSQMKAMAEDLK